MSVMGVSGWNMSICAIVDKYMNVHVWMVLDVDLPGQYSLEMGSDKSNGLCCQREDCFSIPFMLDPGSFLGTTTFMFIS